ncbi:hypothetical protein EXIGLDRAFT_307487 [Exidia glandulosa HHB12029]|uniref:Uncharacterized protein n=1 Tax=Exidia glandulosa HHB12029 TaxID=1314781 RepID=A0A165D2V0_EXIGL|nr:hypothetical protein EXIGLDRAFT_307487 [Exidia glandulosa HHB12029]
MPGQRRRAIWHSQVSISTILNFAHRTDSRSEQAPTLTLARTPTHSGIYCSSCEPELMLFCGVCAQFLYLTPRPHLGLGSLPCPRPVQALLF